MNGSALNGGHSAFTSWQEPTAPPIGSALSQPEHQEAAGTWDGAADDGTGFFDDSPEDSLPQPDGIEAQRNGEASASAPEHEAALSYASQDGQQAESAWKPEASNGSPSVSPFTALSSEVPSDWYSQQEVSLLSSFLPTTKSLFMSGTESEVASSTVILGHFVLDLCHGTNNCLSRQRAIL